MAEKEKGDKMPNNIYNIVTFDCSHERAKEILDAVRDDDYGPGSIDFNKLIPMPEDVYTGPLGEKEQKLYPGEKNWYGWSIENWGTKWPAYGSDTLPKIEDALVFKTAWAAVPKIIETLSKKFPDVEVGYSWADEDFGSNTGMVTFKNGDAQSIYIPPDRSPEAYEFAAAVFGATVEEPEPDKDRTEDDASRRESGKEDRGKGTER